MGFFSEFNKALNGEPAGNRFEIAEKELTCPHCGNRYFMEREALLDGRAMSFLNIEEFGSGATTLTCTNCGHVDWFANHKVIVKLIEK